MLDPQKAAELDQQVKFITDAFPPLWWGLFVGLKEQGFTETQALYLLAEYIKSH